MNSGLINEYYISQYLERLILEDEKFGSVICCRQNSKEPTGHPWLMLTCKNGAASASTDGMLFYGKTFRETGIPEGLMSDRLGGEYAGESSVLAIQEQPFKLDSGEVHKNAFIATYLPDHPIATSAEDLKRLPGLMEEFKNEILLSNPNGIIHPQRNLFNTAPLLQVDDFNDKELNHFFGKKRRHSEKENGQLLSFFSEKNNHIVLRTKETITDRPHAHIMQAKAGLIPTEDIISNTSFAFGVFSSHLTQGNTNFNTLLSVCTSQFNQSWESGQRIFVEMNGCKYLLGVPSAFEIGLNHCRWIYKHGESCFQIRTWTSKKAPQVNLDFKVISGNPVKLLITHNFDDINGWDIIDGSTIGEYVVKPGADSMIAAKFLQAQFRIIIQNSFSDYRASGE
jgi:cellobiose phosphorylase